MAYSLIYVFLGLQLCLTTIGKLKATVEEEQPSGTFVADVSSQRLIRGMEYTLLTSNPFFNIDKNTGIITTSAVIDREAVHRKVFNLDVLAADESLNVIEWIPVEILIQDLNDNTPSWPNKTEFIAIPENISPGSKFPLAAAHDFDSFKYSTQNYSIVGGNANNTFSLEISHFKRVVFVDLIVVKELDRERTSSYSLTLEASDGSNRTARKKINVQVLDVNEHGVRFSQLEYKGSVYENRAVGQWILNVSVSDLEVGNSHHVRYSIDPYSNFNNAFQINPYTGAIHTNKVLDYESKKEYRLEIIAEDSRPHGVAVRAHAIIQIIDENDNTPTIAIHTFATDPSPMIPEDALLGDVAVFLYVEDKDSGENGDVTCELSGSHGDFSITSLRENHFIIHVVRELALERHQSYQLQVTAKDKGQPSRQSEVSFKVKVTDTNTHTPKFEREYYDIIVPAETKQGAVLLSVKAHDGDKGRNADIIYSLVSVLVLEGQKNRTVVDQPWFGIHAKTGEVFLVSEFPCEYSVLFLFVRARDNGFNSRSTTIPVRVITFCSKFFPGQSVYHFYVSENQRSGTVVGEVNFPWYKHAHVSSFPYPVISLDSEYFRAGQLGVISTKRVLDRESAKIHKVSSTIQFGAVKKGVQFIIHVQDENDNSPFFGNNTKEMQVDIPHARPTYHVMRLKAFDLDDGVNGDIIFSMSNQSEKGTFTIHPSSGDIFLVKNITRTIYELTISATDKGKVPNTAYLKLTVLVKDNPVHSYQMSSEFLRLNDIIIILVTLTCIFLALLIAFIIWRKRRRNCGQSSEHGTRLYSVHYTPRRDLIVRVSEGQVITRTINHGLRCKRAEHNRHLSVDYSHITEVSKYDNKSCSSSSGFEEDGDSGKGESDRDQRNSNCSSVRSIHDGTSERKKLNHVQKKLNVIGKRLASSSGEVIPMTSLNTALAERKLLVPETLTCTDMNLATEDCYLMARSLRCRQDQDGADYKLPLNY